MRTLDDCPALLQLRQMIFDTPSIETVPDVIYLPVDLFERAELELERLLGVVTAPASTPFNAFVFKGVVFRMK